LNITTVEAAGWKFRVAATQDGQRPHPARDRKGAELLTAPTPTNMPPHHARSHRKGDRAIGCS